MKKSFLAWVLQVNVVMLCVYVCVLGSGLEGW